MLLFGWGSCSCWLTVTVSMQRTPQLSTTKPDPWTRDYSRDRITIVADTSTNAESELSGLSVGPFPGPRQAALAHINYWKN